MALGVAVVLTGGSGTGNAAALGTGALALAPAKAASVTEVGYWYRGRWYGGRCWNCGNGAALGAGVALGVLGAAAIAGAAAAPLRPRSSIMSSRRSFITSLRRASISSRRRDRAAAGCRPGLWGRGISRPAEGGSGNTASGRLRSPFRRSQARSLAMVTTTGSVNAAPRICSVSISASIGASPPICRART